MQKIKTKSLTILLLIAMVLATIPFVSASTGFMTINIASPGPSTVGQQIPAGGDASLDTAGVTWSGGQIILYFSTDGFSQISTTDFAYSPTLELSNITSVTPSTYTNALGSWTVGSDWINGTIPKAVAGGDYYIKAFDGTATAVAVTDTYITVIANFDVMPASGPGGADITLNGYAFPSGALVNFSYFDTTWHTIADLVATNSLGAITYNMTAPDLMEVLSPGSSQPIANTTITFQAIENATAATYTDTYDEFMRGLKQVGTALAPTGTLWGNYTWVTSFSVMPGDSLIIAGNYFRPSTVDILWDGTDSLGTAAVSQAGTFNTTVTVPHAGEGTHNVVVADAGVNFVFTIDIDPKIALSPTKGQVGQQVKVDGWGFPAATATTAYNVTVYWEGNFGTFGVTSALTGTNGNFTAYFTVPSDYGGSHLVTAIANDTASTNATANFAITPTFTVTPDEFANDCDLIVVAAGSGFDPDVDVVPNIDNTYIGMDPLAYDYPTNLRPNASGYIYFEFVGCGFRPGEHVVSLYAEGDTEVLAWDCFTVTDEGDVIADLIKEVNSTIVGTVLSIDVSADVAIIKSDTSILRTQVTALNAAVIKIDNGVATILTDLGLLTADVAELNALIVDISGDLVTIQTDLGIIKTSIAAINPVLVEIQGDIATVQTDIGVLTGTVSDLDDKVDSIDGKVDSIDATVDSIEGTVDSTAGKVATIETDVGTIIVDVGTLQEDVAESTDTVSGLSLPIWLAVAFAIIAAIAAIACVLIVRRKIAG